MPSAVRRSKRSSKQNMGSTEEEFAELRRLLALKRREQPPPGYFNTFAGKVVARIEAEGLAQRRPWWVRFFSPAEWVPVGAGANTAVFAGLAVLGGTALLFKNRFERRSPMGSTNLSAQPGLDSAISGSSSLLISADATVNSREFLGSVRGGLVRIHPESQFRLRRPSVQERVERLNDSEVPASLFEPWNDSSISFPTSIGYSVESPR